MCCLCFASSWVMVLTQRRFSGSESRVLFTMTRSNTSRAKWHHHALSMLELFELVRFDNLSIFGICFFFFNKHICKCQILKNTIYRKLCLAWSVLKVLLAWVRVSRFETDWDIQVVCFQVGSLSSHPQVIRLSGTFIIFLPFDVGWFPFALVC